MRAIAYTYEADVHCPECARQRFSKRRLAHKPTSPDCYDEHGIDINQRDREGNFLGVVFDITEDPDGPFTHCGDCHERI